MKVIIILLAACATLAFPADAIVSAAEAAVKAEKQKLAGHVAALANTQMRANLPNLTPQERAYINNAIAAQNRYIQESYVRIGQAESALVRIKLLAKAPLPAPQKNDAAQPQPAAPPKPVAAQPLKVVTLHDGKTIEILRFIETENEYNVQTPDRKFQVIAKDLVKSIQDKVSSGVKD